MKPKNEAWSVVIVGFWNRMIFTPEWVGKKLFQVEVLEKLIPLIPVAPLIYRTEHVELIVDSMRLVFHARKSTPDCISEAEELAISAMEKLPETPISAVGINFGFSEVQPDDNLLDLFNFKDNIDIGELGWQTGSRTIVREFEKNECRFNLTLSLKAGVLDIDTMPLRFFGPVSFKPLK
jgi:hypothetical protein